MKFTIKTLYGLEQVLESELHALDASNIQVLNRAVQCEGNPELLYRANLQLRTALRVLLPLESFVAHNDRHLYQQCTKIDWSRYIREGQTFAINSTANSQRFRHSHYAALKVKDAIVDQFREKYGKRPSIDTRDPDIYIDLHISETEVTLSLDSSGESLEKRGYRTEHNEAPISEVLAAGMLLIAQWHGNTPLLDAMTGSGTIAIEAAMLAAGIAPGLHRRFAFEKWSSFDQALLDRLKKELADAGKVPEHQIVARDKDSRNLSIAKRNATRAGVVEHVTFERADLLDSKPFSPSAGIFINPPYGERLEDPEEMNALYSEIGSRLKHHYPGHKLWVISANLPALKRLGFKHDQSFKLYNGPLECRLNGYTLFAGKAHERG